MSNRTHLVVKYIIYFILIYQTKAQLQEQKIETYEPCSYDSECNLNAFCFGNDDNRRGTCKCKDGFELNRNRTFYECLPGVRLDQACERNFQCQVTAGPMALCNRYKICQCNELSHNYTDGLCYKTVNLTEHCLADPNCLLDGNKFGYCSDGHCSCNLNERPSPDLRRCLISRKLGEQCSVDEDCLLVANARCADVCRCSMDYTVSRNGTMCLKAATSFGESCIENDQCSKYLLESLCVQGNCSCVDGQHGYGKGCVPTAKPGEACTDTEQCVFVPELTDKVECVNNYCVCTYESTDDGYRCSVGSLIRTSTILNVLCLIIFYLL